MPTGADSAAARLARRRVVSELLILQPVFQSVFDYLPAAGSTMLAPDSTRQQTVRFETVLIAPP